MDEDNYDGPYQVRAHSCCDGCNVARLIEGNVKEVHGKEV